MTFEPVFDSNVIYVAYKLWALTTVPTIIIVIVIMVIFKCYFSSSSRKSAASKVKINAQHMWRGCEDETK